MDSLDIAAFETRTQDLARRRSLRHDLPDAAGRRAPHPHRTRDCPPAEHRLEIRLRRRHFRVVDADGRTFAEVAAEATDPRGFGRMPRTMEGFMDATSTALYGPAGAPSSFTGDLATGLGTAIEAGGEPREVPARLVAPIAEQVLAGDTVDGRDPVGEGRVLRTPLRGVPLRADRARTRAVRTAATSACSCGAGLVLLRDVRDAAVPGLRATAEVVELDRG